MAYKKKGEVHPLLSTDWTGTPTYKQKPLARNIRHDEREEMVVIEDDDDIFDVVDQKKKRTVNLVWIDVALLILDFLQILALLQSMSLRWTWPGTWVRNTWFIFAFNVDVWEIMKFKGSYSYSDNQDTYISSADIDISFRTIAIGWFIAAGALCLVFIVTYFVISCYYPRPWARRFASWFQYAFVLIIHALSLPFGVVLFRSWQCERLYGKVDTINSLDCFETAHWYLLAPALGCMVLLFAVYPAFLILKTRCDYTRGKPDSYLSTLMLKETEYKLHLNWSWLYHGMWLYSSFKSRGIYYRAIIQFMKAILLVIYVAAFNNIQFQSIFTAIALLLFLILFIFIRPFRLTSCNVFLVFSFLCLLTDAFIGSLRAAYDAYTLSSAWLLPQYVVYLLGGVQVCWLISVLVLLVYLVSRTLCHSSKRCYKRPVWPNIASSGSGQLTTETRKYMTVIIRTKLFYEKARRAPAMFAPVHELARHIHILNAYFREAEYLRDPLQMALWEVLDDIIELHADVSPRSLFAGSVKKSIQTTATKFLRMVPMFSQRLAQRDYDMILIPPVKKRMLLKMYCMGMFLNGRSEKVAKKRSILDPAVKKVWPSLPEDQQFEEEDGYYEDLYPRTTGDYFTEDIRNVFIDKSADEESSEEEDHVQHMLHKLPEVGLIDLEPPVFELPPVPEPESREPTMLREETMMAPNPLLRQPASLSSKSSGTPRITPPGSASGFGGPAGPLRQHTHGLMASMLQELKPYRQETEELSPIEPQGSVASLRDGVKPQGSVASLRDGVKPQGSVASLRDGVKPQGSVASLRDGVKPQGSVASLRDGVKPQGSVASLRDDDRKSPAPLVIPDAMRPGSAGSTTSMEPSRPTSAGSRAGTDGEGQANVNQGYIAGDEEGDFDAGHSKGVFKGDNQGYIHDEQTDDYYEDSDGGAMSHKSGEESQTVGEGRPVVKIKKKRKKKQKRRKSIKQST